MSFRRRRAKDVGICGIQVYFPRTVVSQKELEIYDGVRAGKYTIGLGQTNMAFVGDREDINSICLTVVKRLLEDYQIDPRKVGRLEIGTETIIDKSKATKTVVMDIFGEYGNSNIEGIDCKNACYGGTSALLNSIAWVESSAWDGRYAIAVAADIAVYAEGNARPTGGCGAVAMLIGENATLVMNGGVRATHMENVYDFYKPEPTSEYPTVDGKLSIECYLRAVDKCYMLMKEKHRKAFGEDLTTKKGASHFIFHSPYNKLVQKSFARMAFNDLLCNPKDKDFESVAKFKDLKREETYFNRDLEKSFLKLSKPLYDEKVGPGTILPKELGNTYCASLYCGLVSLISFAKSDLVGSKIVLFSYGSGLASTMFSFTVKKSLKDFKSKLDLKNRLSNRRFVRPGAFAKTLKLREKRYLEKDYIPVDALRDIDDGVYYLQNVDDKFRRFYIRNRPARSRM